MRLTLKKIKNKNKNKITLFWTVWVKLSGIPDSLAQTVDNPDSQFIFLDGLKPFRINRLKFFLNGFTQFPKLAIFFFFFFSECTSFTTVYFLFFFFALTLNLLTYPFIAMELT
jgi:hypothetical protein